MSPYTRFILTTVLEALIPIFSPLKDYNFLSPPKNHSIIMQLSYSINLILSRGFFMMIDISELCSEHQFHESLEPCDSFSV